MRLTSKLGHWKSFFKKHLEKEYWVILVKRLWLKRTIKAAAAILLLSWLGVTYYFYFYDGGLTDDYGREFDLNKLKNSDFKKSSYLYASDGTTKIGIFFDEVRDPITSKEIPEILKQALVAAEDQRFNSHHGVDWSAILRAAICNQLHKIAPGYFRKSGASTIDSQFARLIYAEESEAFKNREPSYSRKIKEARVAIQLDKHYPKEKIMEGFLNMIYFGHGVNGVEEAARRYFDKDLRREKLSLREAAILASLNKAPSLYCPVYHKPQEPEIKENLPEKEKNKIKERYAVELAKENVRISHARERYNWVLERMLKEGFINEEQEKEAHFTNEEHPQLEFVKFTPIKDNRFGYANRFTKEMLLTTGYSDEDLCCFGGLRITTTLDQQTQKIAEEEFRKHLAEVNKEIPVNEEKLEGAFVIIENSTGKILALSGGHNFSDTQYNRVMASRSPGSAFKPFTYAAAFEYFGQTFDNSICNCPFQMKGGSGKTWAPRNFKEENPVPNGYIPLPVGLIRSVNLATLNLARNIGIQHVVDVANKTGIWGNPGFIRDSGGKTWFRKPGQELEGGLVPLLPTAIGASDVNLIELANAFTVFFREGNYIRPTLITEIVDQEGKKIYKAKSNSKDNVLSKDSADKVLMLMRAVTKIGTAKVSMRNIDQQVAVKTGTSNGPRDLLMVGGTPELTIAIRVGHDSNKIIRLPEYMKKVAGRSDMNVSGGWVVGPLFRKMVDRIYKKRKKAEFRPEIEDGLSKLLEKLGNK